MLLVSRAMGVSPLAFESIERLTEARGERRPSRSSMSGLLIFCGAFLYYELLSYFFEMKLLRYDCTSTCVASYR